MKKERIGNRFARQVLAAGLVLSLAGAGLGTNALIEAAGGRQPAHIIFVHGQKQIQVNGKVQPLTAPLPVVKGVTMIPIRTIAAAVGAKVYNDDKGTHIDTYANQVTLNAGMRGARRNDSYILLPAAPVRIDGTMHLPLSAVKQLWNGGYTYNTQLKQVHITIQPDPNAAPVAAFQAPTAVKLGEPVAYEDLSYDPDGSIAKTEWSGRKSAYFEPGVYTVTQTVIDNEGLRSVTESQEIVVTDEVMYTPFEYYMRYGNPGDKFAVDTKLMNSYNEAATVESRGGRTLYMSNAPERFFGEGLLYADELDGAGRLFLHHRNGSSERLKAVVVVTNEQSESVKLTIGKRGLAGPSVNALQFGSAAVLRYLSGAAPRELEIAPGASVTLLPELEKIIMNPNEGFSGMLDVDSDGPLTYTTMAVKENTDPLSAVFNLPQLEKVGNRGTFADTDLMIEVNEPLGITERKLRLGSRGTTIPGVDALTGEATVDGGEYGAVTTVQLTNVAYGTRILLNPRAGNFQGAVAVNGKAVGTPSAGHANPGDGVLLYHQQKPEGENADHTAPPEVTITFASPGASALPVLLVFLPGNEFE
ncbi:stalk domain-containing protein [Paenibacillus harenae]|uniref:stalk domain-containing protein n=1 Tax=Paenibacillus harenae TaxID=306543 RepID=UPI000414F39F|nr:stalk domain-containing protein [Paenibacillus harenae]